MSAASPIYFDIQTGKITGAVTHEWLALRLLQLAVLLMLPFHLFGFSYVCRAIRTVLPSRRKIVFQLDSDSQMLTDYCDPYWSILLQRKFVYEWENASLVHASRFIQYGFIDGGANHGYWSALVSGKAAGRKPVIAIEAASDTYVRLEQNRTLNHDRFLTLNRAIGAVSGEQVLIYGAKHEMRSTIAPDATSKPILDCVTVSLDELAAHEQFSGISKFIVKLDVEGVEIAAMTAATQLQKMDTIFLYEDHGSDTRHETTRHVIDNLGMEVFWLGRHVPASQITNVAQLDAIKKSRRFGYDFAASKSPFWIEHLKNAVQDIPQHDAKVAA